MLFTVEFCAAGASAEKALTAKDAKYAKLSQSSF